MKKLGKYYSFFFVLILLSGCIAEYDDGPFISFKSHMARLHGTWDVEILVIGGTDSTSYVKNQQCYQPMRFLSDDEGNGTTNLVPRDGTKCGPEGNYWLSDDCDYLTIGFHEGTPFNPIGPFGISFLPPNWEIKKLTSNELRLECTYRNMLCRMHLKKL